MPRPRPAAPLAAAPGPRAPDARGTAGVRGGSTRALALAVALTLVPGAARAGEPADGLSKQTGEADGRQAPPAGGAPELSDQTGEADGPRPPALASRVPELSEQTGEAYGRQAPPAGRVPELSEQTGEGAVMEMSPGTGSQADQASARPAPGAEAATRWTAEGQRRRGVGDLDGAIAAWQQAIAALPVTQATAHRRAGLALAIATAHAEAARARPERLVQALAVLDAYLAGLDPTDDENRVAVEQRRAELAARLAPVAAAAAAPAPVSPRSDRRLLLAGGVGLGLGVVGLGVLGGGLLAGTRADRDLATAVELPGDDPGRESQKDAAAARGIQANRLAIAGGVVGGVLVLAGVALMIAGVRRPSPRRASAVPRLASGGLRWHF